MINKPHNWENIKPVSERQQLPLGAYVCRIMVAAVKTSQYGRQYLQVSFDICEGAQTGFYAQDYQSNTNPNRKWRGFINQGIPTDDGSPADEKTKSYFMGFVKAVEDSNPGYAWDWDETSLRGKVVGVLFRNEEWEYNGQTGWNVRPMTCMGADRVRNGDYTLTKDKPLTNRQSSSGFAPTNAAPTAQNNGFTAVETDELPF